MTPTEARAVLGVSVGTTWEDVRAAYRSAIRRAHPDVVGAEDVDHAVRLNTAYRVLADVRRFGEPEPGPPAPRREVRVPVRVGPVGTAPDVGLLDDNTLVLSSTPEESFRRLVDAVHALGEISYVDRSAAIFEAVLRTDDGTPASFVVSLQWRAHDATCEAFCTLEALDRAESLPVRDVLEALVPFIPVDRSDEPPVPPAP